MMNASLLIGGRWESARDGSCRDILCPADGRTIARVSEAGAEDVVRAVAEARHAFDAGPWRQTGRRERAQLLNGIGDLIDTHAEELAGLETLNTGKTLVESRTDMGDIAATFRYFAGQVIALGEGEVHEAPEHVISRSLHEPVGVCALITPWNYPLLQAAWKIAPALGAGNTVVLKPSELTPLTSLRFAQLLEGLGLPPGVFNLITGAGAAGAALSESMDVDLVSFTGGAESGRRVMQAASGNFKRLALELGGKNPNVVFADADMTAAVDYALNAGLFHAGQVCSAGSRLLLQDSIHDEFVSRLVERMQRVRIGLGTEEGTELGPVQSQVQRARIQAMVAVAKAAGARVAYGGGTPTVPEALSAGFWLEPTLLTGITADMVIAQEEIFGPVITVERFHDEDEALALANGTPYGLAGAVWTSDMARANRMSRRMRFGTVWVNDYHPYFPEAPWGGFKASGIGRELSRLGLHEYTELKHCYFNLSPAPLDWFGVQVGPTTAT